MLWLYFVNFDVQYKIWSSCIPVTLRFAELYFFYVFRGGGGEEESLKNQDLNIKHENGYQFCIQKWASSKLLKQVL